MLNAVTTLLVFQLAGEAATQAFDLPVPGPVVGMLLLFVVLSARLPLARRLLETAQDMLQHLSLLFVPAGVGVMLHVRRVTDEWLALVVALIISTILAVVMTAVSIKLLARLIRTGADRG